jgi:hypothetical protein
VSKRFVVVHEARADFAIATELADRVLTAEIDWLDESLLESQRAWVGQHQAGGYLTWTSIPSRAREFGIRVHGYFDGEPGLADAKAARRAIAYVLRVCDSVDAIILVRDADNQTERRGGLEQARAAYAPGTVIVVGLAVPERECWVISGFEPMKEDEQRALALEVQKLGFDPCSRSHELTAGRDDRAIKSPKRVLAVLTGGDWERQRDCWQQTPLSTLDARGQSNGLREYITEIRSRLVPLITGH